MKRLGRPCLSCGIILLTGVGSDPGLRSLARVVSAGESASPLAIPSMAGRILTVKGPIEPDTLGPTIMREHIFLDWRVSPPRRMPPMQGCMQSRYRSRTSASSEFGPRPVGTTCC